MKHAFPKHYAPQSLLALVFLVSFAITVSAQNPRIVHKITKDHTSPPVLGRDLWFAPLQNFMAQHDKYIAIYITSERNTTVHVQQGTDVSTRKDISVAAYTLATFQTPLDWEIISSAVVEPKAIHVWSDDADILVYMMSHSPFTSDGMYVIPTIGWGNDYVVAGFAALDQAGVGGDDPSEFVVVADQDNTHVFITPACDLRGTGDPASVEYPAGQQFGISLNKGESIQFKSTRGEAADAMDVTGTFIHSNVPVGVMGGSQCPFIPVGDAACDHVVEMMPPIRTWAKTYYTAPFFNRKNGDTFCLLGTKDGQVIYRTDAVTPKRPFATLSRNIPFWDNSTTTACRWESDTSFMLVQYINSAQHDGIGASNGDPAEVVINSVEQFAKTIIFETPLAIGAQTPYTNYVNIVVNKAAEDSTTFDGASILKKGYTVYPVDGVYDIFVIPNVKTGAHIIRCDSAVGAYIYGYGRYESYAWAGMLGTVTLGTHDTISPAALPRTDCFDAHVDLSDTGKDQTLLSYIRVDSIVNMSYLLDSNWVAGSGRPFSFYGMSVLDDAKPGFLVVSIFDVAGNRTTVRSSYTPWIATIGPPQLNIGVGDLLGPAIYGYDTIVNVGKVPYPIGTLRLVPPDTGFTIDSGANLSTPLQPGEKRIIRIAFWPKSAKTVSDTLIFGDTCKLQSVVMFGSGGTGYHVDDWDFGPVLLGSSKTHRVLVHNYSKTGDIHITNITVDSSEFTFDPTVLAGTGLLVKARDTAGVPFTFTPKYLTRDTTAGHWSCTELGAQNDQLIGRGVLPGTTLQPNIFDTLNCAHPGDSVHLLFTLNAIGNDKSFINNITHSAKLDTNWRKFTRVFQNGQLVDTTQAFELDQGQEVFISEIFVVPAKVNGIFVDTVTVSSSTNTGLYVIATIVCASRGGTALPNSITFNTTPYQSHQLQTQQIVITDTGASDLRIDSVNLEPGRKYNNAFTLSTVPTLPQTLKSGEKITITVQFTPDSSFDAFQDAVVMEYGNNCSPMSAPIEGRVGVSGDAMTGFKADSILACYLHLDSVYVKNMKPSAVIIDTITDVQIMGMDSLLFALERGAAAYHLKTIPGGDSLSIPIVFGPSNKPASIAVAKTYNAIVRVILHNNRTDPGSQTIDTVFQTIQGIAQGLQVAASSAFVGADQTIQASNDYIARLPIGVSVTGFSSMVGTLGINTVKLTYLFDADLLDIQNNDIVSHFSGIKGWTVDPASKLVLDSRRVGATPKTPAFIDTLYLTLTNAKPLDDQTSSLGTINFRIALSYHDSTTAITMQSIQLLAGANPVPGCVDTSMSGGTFSIVYRCGNQVLMDYMNGNTAPIFITKPATPDPVRGGVVSIGYANRGESPLTLTMYDMLGNEVARPLDGVGHAAGSWQINCDVSKLASGTYTYRLSDGRASVSKQFVIQR